MTEYEKALIDERMATHAASIRLRCMELALDLAKTGTGSPDHKTGVAIANAERMAASVLATTNTQ